jgi:hypothetical protein
VNPTKIELSQAQGKHTLHWNPPEKKYSTMQENQQIEGLEVVEMMSLQPGRWEPERIQLWRRIGRRGRRKRPSSLALPCLAWRLTKADGVDSSVKRLGMDWGKMARS